MRILEEYGEKLFDNYLSFTKEALLFDIRNVVQLLYDGNDYTDDAAWDLERDFPIQSPPAGHMWFEFKLPGIQSPVAFYVNSVDGSSNEGARWEVMYYPLLSAPRGIIELPTYRTYVNHEGRIIEAEKMILSVENGLDFGSFSGNPITISSISLGGKPALPPYYAPVLLAVSLMHCKNVSQNITEPDASFIKSRKKKGKPPPLAFRVLGIESFKDALASEGKVTEVGLKKAFHICRGHFATYSKEKPLFGKYEGTFWKSSHARGALSRNL